MELREQIARAIHGQCDRDLDASWGDWLPEADAVLEVLAQQKPVFWGPRMAIENRWDSVTVRSEPANETDIPLFIAPGAVAAVPEAQDTADLVSKALRQAYQLGQTYWQQADSDRTKDWAKADATQEKFHTLVDETRAVLLGPPDVHAKLVAEAMAGKS